MKSKKQRKRQRRQARLRRARRQRRDELLRCMLPLVGAHNLGGFSFNLNILMLLNRGLKFVSTPPTLAASTLQGSLDRFCRSVRLRCQFGNSSNSSRFRVPKPGFVPRPAPAPVEGFLTDLRDAVQTRFRACIVHSRPAVRHNLTPAEREGLQALRQQRDYIIKPADKNLGLCMMRVDDYREAVRSHVLDAAVYSRVVDIQEATSKVQLVM